MLSPVVRWGVDVVIRKYLTGAALLGLLAGCTSDWDPARSAKAASPGGAWSPGSVALPADMLLPDAAGAHMPGQFASLPHVASTRAPGEFASLPDRGELMAYDKSRRPRTSGAYRAYPVRLSEEHALKAAHVGGWMIINAPDGEKIELAYERHVEHPDGNWTWIGRDAKGAEAVITFGAAATFGTLPETGGDTLRLTMAGGYAWLVVTDRSKIADINRAVTRIGKKDYLIPPKTASAAVSDKATTTATAQAAPVAAAAVVQTTVDVVVGYTVGLRDALGGSSQAVTRINHLVDITNQAYANSAINAQLRLVGTVSVDYPDATDNGEALEELTGQTGSGPTTPHPAFAALRAARETYHADLVSLLRDFKTPENNGCGIAWLIGGGQSGIGQGDAPFGYSVVSDGSDTDGNDNYLCREESFAHELGHNMGQAHNIEVSGSNTGAHAYSYGYREASTNGFYTVMAYSLGDDQTPIRHFANPSITYDGRVTGMTNVSDNARSMNLTMPIIAMFRAGAVSSGEPARNDVNADGRSDLLWSNQGAGEFTHWLMNGANVYSTADYTIGPSFDAIGSGDLDGNGYVDVIWRHRTNGQVYVWLRTAAAYSARYISTIASGWVLVGVADTNADGKGDLLWSKPSTGQFVQWTMNGAVITRGANYTIGAAFDAVGTGDLDGNGYDDVIWKHRTNGQVYVWLRTPTAYLTRYISAIAAGWTLAGVGDVNADGKADLLWSKASTGQFVHWTMNGATITSGGSYTIGAAFDAIGTGDLDGNGYTDVIWRNRSNGQIYVWLRSATRYSAVFIDTLSGWTLMR